MDFEEPKKVETSKPAKDGTMPSTGSTDAGAAGEVQEVRVEEMTRDDFGRLKLEDAGEGPQPLRLLGCGHVFHVSSVIFFQ
jgi:hypothetical protein